MAKSEKMYKGKYIARCLLSAFVVILYVGAIALTSNTLIDWWIPFATSGALAVLTGIYCWKMWRWFTTSGKFLWNYITHVLAFTGIIAAIFYIGNYAFADHSTAHSEKAGVEKVYYKVQYHTKRIRKNRYGRGEPYNVYYMKIRLENGMVKDIKIPHKKYMKTRKGDTVTIPIAKGCFGVPVILYESRTKS